MDNQDALFGIQGSSRMALGLCDGAGFTPYGKEAAQQAAPAVAELFYRRFWELMLADLDTVRGEVCSTVLPRLRSYAEQKQIPPGWMASTLLVAAMDKEGRYICAHLGDGAILEQAGEERFRMVSNPSNGMLPNSTYLTMNVDMMQHLKITRSADPGRKKLLLVTDGADRLLRPDSRSRQLPCPFSGAAIEAYLDAQRPSDDYSAIEITSC